MKKVIAILIMGLLVLSAVPLALAEERGRERPAVDQGQTTPERKAERRQKADEFLQNAKDNRDKMREKAVDRGEAARMFAEERVQKLKELRESEAFQDFRKERGFRAREINKDLKARFQMVSKDHGEKLNEHKAGAMERRVALKEAKKALDACAENCDELEAAVENEATLFLGNSANAILAALEKFKARIESSEHIDEAKAAEMLEKLDAKITEVKAIATQLENKDLSREELRELASTLNASWKGTKERLEETKDKLSHGRVGGAVVQAEHMQLRLENTVSRLEGRGIDTANLQPLMDAFNAKVADAKASFEENDVEAGKESLKAARDILKDIVKQVKNLGGEDDLEEASNEEAEGGESEDVA